MILLFLCLEHAHGCLGAWESGPVGPGSPPLGSWCTSQGLPGGGPGPKLQGSLSLVDPLNSHQNLCRFWCRFLIVLGSILGPSWESLSIMLTPFSAQVGPGTVFEPSYHRKSEFSRNIGRRSVWSVSRAQKSTQNDPRSPQDGSKIVLDRFFHLLIFRFDFVSFSVRFWLPKWLPRGARELG